MSEGRKQFTFYRSYYDALRIASKSVRMVLYEAIASYALDGVEPELKGTAASIFALIKPTLDTGRRKAESGKAGGTAYSPGKQSGSAEKEYGEGEKQEGTKREAKQKQGASKAEASGKEIGTEKEKEKEREKENEKEVEGETLARAREACGVSPAAVAAVVDAYRSRINPMASETSLVELEGFARTVGPDCCLRAFDIALDAKAANWRYIRGILSSIRSQGVRSLADWDAIEQHRRGEKTRSQGPQIGCGWRPPQRTEAEAQAVQAQEDRMAQEDLDRVVRMMGLDAEGAGA